MREPTGHPQKINPRVLYPKQTRAFVENSLAQVSTNINIPTGAHSQQSLKKGPEPSPPVWDATAWLLVIRSVPFSADKSPNELGWLTNSKFEIIAQDKLVIV